MATVTLDQLLVRDDFRADARVNVVLTLTRARCSPEHRVWLFGHWCERVGVEPEAWEVRIIWRGRNWCTCGVAQPAATDR